jgi:hypothetical protein
MSKRRGGHPLGGQHRGQVASVTRQVTQRAWSSKTPSVVISLHIVSVATITTVSIIISRSRSSLLLLSSNPSLSSQRQMITHLRRWSRSVLPSPHSAASSSSHHIGQPPIGVLLHADGHGGAEARRQDLVEVVGDHNKEAHQERQVEHRGRALVVPLHLRRGKGGDMASGLRGLCVWAHLLVLWL